MGKRYEKYLKSYNKGRREFEKRTGRKYRDYGEGRGQEIERQEQEQELHKQKRNPFVGFVVSFLKFVLYLVLCVFVGILVGLFLLKILPYLSSEMYRYFS